MLNKIIKIIGFGAIVGLNNLNSWGGWIDVSYEGGPTIIAKGLGRQLPKELSDPQNELWNEYTYLFELIGVRLNFPKEIIEIFEDKYWEIHDEALIQELEEIVFTEDTFYAWCRRQTDFNKKSSTKMKYLLSIYAYVLKKANEKNFFVAKEFCKRVDIVSKIKCIYLKRTTPCIYELELKTPAEYYLEKFEKLTKYMYVQIEDM